MPIVNMCMNMGSFKININVKKDEEMKNKLVMKHYNQDIRIKKALEMRNNIDEKYNIWS